MNNLIQPKILKGFRDFLPEAELKRDLLIEQFTGVFRSYGFMPIDTPALEYSEILLRKTGGETEKQVFRFTDNGGRDVAMRFDLTVPLARFIAEHNSELYFPFKRYHIGKVWRGEKPQAGRYREFLQCDFDVIGSETAAADFEILRLIQKALNAVDIGGFKIHISHRGVFNRFLDLLNLREKSEEILRIVDKLAKIGKENVVNLLADITSEEDAEKIYDYISLGDKNKESCDFEKMLLHIENLAGGKDNDTESLRKVYSFLCAYGIQDYFVLDTSVTRGLDYYTGIVYETFLENLTSIGSVCSGGRYDNLTGLYMKEPICGVGASIGLDRLLAAMEQFDKKKSYICFIDAIIFYSKKMDLSISYKAACFLEKNGINVEVYHEDKKMNHQYTYAEKKGIGFGIFILEDAVALCGENDFGSLKIRLKNLVTREEKEIQLKNIPDELYKNEKK